MRFHNGREWTSSLGLRKPPLNLLTAGRLKMRESITVHSGDYLENHKID